MNHEALTKKIKDAIKKADDPAYAREVLRKTGMYNSDGSLKNKAERP